MSVALLCLFTAVATWDGLYLHLWKYRLHLHPASRREHLLHTANAILFPLTLAPLFLADVAGGWLWLTAALHAVVLVIECVDTVIEPESRAALGGLSGVEACLHFLMSGLRWAYVALAFAAIPAERWWTESTWSWRPPLQDAGTFVAWAIVLAGVPVAALHVAVMPTPRARAVAS